MHNNWKWMLLFSGEVGCQLFLLGWIDSCIWERSHCSGTGGNGISSRRVNVIGPCRLCLECCREKVVLVRLFVDFMRAKEWKRWWKVSFCKIFTDASLVLGSLAFLYWAMFESSFWHTKIAICLPHDSYERSGRPTSCSNEADGRWKLKIHWSFRPCHQTLVLCSPVSFGLWLLVKEDIELSIVSTSCSE